MRVMGGLWSPSRSLLPWAFAALIVFVATLAMGSALSRVGQPRVSNADAAPVTDVASGVSATDRHISRLQDRLRQVPSDQKSATALGLADLQRARETSDPSYLTRADGILHQAFALQPTDTDSLVGLGSLALARHQFQDAVDWGQRAIASNPYHAPSYALVIVLAGSAITVQALPQVL